MKGTIIWTMGTECGEIEPIDVSVSNDFNKISFLATDDNDQEHFVILEGYNGNGQYKAIVNGYSYHATLYKRIGSDEYVLIGNFLGTYEGTFELYFSV